MIGTISEPIQLIGKIENQSPINGFVSIGSSLIGNINNSLDIKGCISTLAISGLLTNQSSISGTLTIGSSGYTSYEGAYDVVPKETSQELATRNKVLNDNVRISEIPYFETSNLYGETIYIGSEVNYGN